MRRLKDGKTIQLTCDPLRGDITSFNWYAQGYEGCDVITIIFSNGSNETLFGVSLEVVEAWMKEVEKGNRSEIFYNNSIKEKYYPPTESSSSTYPLNEIKAVDMLDFILKKIETMTEKEARGVKHHAEIRLEQIEAAKPWNNREIPEYLQRCVEPISEYMRNPNNWYDDVWYHAAKDGKMGKQIRSPKDIPIDATHLIEIHK